MNILIIGASGNIGRAISRSLQSDSNNVVCVSRTLPTDRIAGIKYLQADRNDISSVLKIIHDNHFDAVIDVIAMTYQSTSLLLEEVAPLIDRYILISSCDVYLNYGLLLRTETGEPEKVAVSELSNLRNNWYPFRNAEPRPDDDPARWRDDYDKIPIEEAVKKLPCDWTILRLPMVYGPGDPQRRFRWLLEPIFRGDKKLMVPSAWLDWKTTYGHVDNVGDLIASATMNAKTSQGIYNISDEEPVSHRIWLDRFRKATDWNGIVEESSSVDIEGFQWLESLDLKNPLMISGQSLWGILNHQQSIDLDRRITETVEDERQHFNLMNQS